MSDKELLAEAKTIVSRWKETDIFDGIVVRKDNRIKAQGVAHFKKRTITINLKKVNNINSLRLVVLHELGHFVHEKSEEGNDEYLSHKFALETIKVFYGDSYQYALDCLKATVEHEGFAQNHPEHYQAFKKLYDEIKEESV